MQPFGIFYDQCKNLKTTCNFKKIVNEAHNLLGTYIL